MELKNRRTESKPGMGFKRKLDLVNYEGYVVDRKTFKTLQIRVGGWVRYNNDYTQRDYERNMRVVKHKIKRFIREQHKLGLFKPESIVDVEFGSTSNKGEDKDYHYAKIDVVLYPMFEYDRHTVEELTKMKVHEVLDLIKEYKETLTFVKSTKKENKNKKKC